MPRYLHVMNGDCTAEPLRQSGVPGDCVVWADVLWSGRLPDTEDPEEWRRVRSAHLGPTPSEREQAVATLREWDAPLKRWREYEEVVLWFEHDLFDQLLLVRHLAWFARQGPKPGRLMLICIDHFPGVEPFHGLGQLGPHQLASLFPRRRPVTAGQLKLGQDAWRAFTADTPTALQRIAEADSSDLPFLPGAVRRYLEEYPAVGDGLSRTERSILEALADEPKSPAQLFGALQAREERVFMGDLSFLEILRAMATTEAPLVELTVDRTETALPAGSAAMTPLGRRVLAGEADRVALAGLDRWHGGVHLHGRAVPWRWDRRQGRIVASPA
jgi:hypothetical protein